MSLNDFEGLKDAIRRAHACDSIHVESVPVHEVFNGQTVWQGRVEVFRLLNHPKAVRCYAWCHSEGAKDEHRRYFAVLELPPVTSAVTAVRAAIMAQYLPSTS